MATWGCERPFGIDGDELEGLRPQECFVLGYELAMIDALIGEGKSFSKPVHAANQDRISAELDRRHREYRFEWMNDDVSESWVELSVVGTTD